MDCWNNNPDFTISAASDIYAVRKILAQAISHNSIADLSPENLGTLELILAEALNNVAEHAYSGGRTGPITLSWSKKSDGLHICIQDTGHPMPDCMVPSTTQPDPNVALNALPEGGFGWFLIRTLAKDLKYSRSGQINCLKLRFPMGKEQNRHSEFAPKAP